MSELIKKQKEISTESYSPKIPELAKMMDHAKGQIKAETLIKQLNDDFSIVECKEKLIVGIKLLCPPLARLNSIDIVRRSILEGTCGLLEKLVGNKNPDQYIAVIATYAPGLTLPMSLG